MGRMLFCAVVVLTNIILSDSVNAMGGHLLVSNPRSCITDSECAKTEYCDASSSYACVERLSLNALCNFNNECEEGATCRYVNKLEQSVCRKRRRVGVKCVQYEDHDCVDGAYCSTASGKCQKTARIEGTACELDSECDQSGGLFCNQKEKMCESKLKEGSTCEPAGDSQYQCNGFCSAPFLNGNGICIDTQKTGQACRADEHCQGDYINDFFEPSHANLQLCNKPNQISEGTCVLESTLLKAIGARCNPKEDKCDGRRSLSCVWDKKTKTHRCHQGIRSANDVPVYCTIGNRFSLCVDDDGPRECRNTSSDPQTTCEKVPHVIPQGRTCRPFGGICESGTTCEKVFGVRRFGNRGGPIEPMFCVKIKAAGESCGNKFFEQCDTGLHCKDGKCSTGQKETPQNDTHADYQASCMDIPCAPGLDCVKLEDSSVPFTASGSEVCLLPKKTVSVGEYCSDTPLNRLVRNKNTLCTLPRHMTLLLP